MNKEQQDLTWVCLPKDVREEIKRLYKDGCKHNRLNRIAIYKSLFGHHNLTSDSEPEEMLMISKQEFQKKYEACVIAANECDSSECAIIADLLEDIFGDKCLPDKEKQAQVEPKFKYNIGDLVTYKGKVKKVIVRDLDWSGAIMYTCSLPNGQSPLRFEEECLESYIEPKPRFKVGDKVKVKGEDKVREVYRILPDGHIMFGDKGNTYSVEDIELVEPETKDMEEKDYPPYLDRPKHIVPTMEENMEEPTSGEIVKNAISTAEEYFENVSINKNDMGEPTKRKEQDKAFKEYAKEGEDEKLLPNHLDTEAIKILDEEKELNLCEILKGHEGETFYSPLYGEVKLLDTSYSELYPIKIEDLKEFRRAHLTYNGHYSEKNKGEVMLFPSKDQRDWNKWDKENNHKTPKTWSEIKNCNVEVWQHISQMDYGPIEPIVKTALALLKIHQLIEVGYGGYPSIEEVNNLLTCVPFYNLEKNKFTESYRCITDVIRFKNSTYFNEFISYPENVQLLKDYYMIND